ncbi:hypothetical protein PYW08_004971 [Mythimna loreyi]|uniref:Uncharacterized protein n=1 Tax=Mythimna loreyi TaxID=667449 RepID=A0ACC2QDT9_9NEOP|nr:hypothetical protein PYW08_004971 [Mythimna loreyi]
MSKLTVIVLAALTVTSSVRCFAEPLDESDSRLSRRDESENLEADPEEVDRSASVQAYPAISNRFAVPYPGNQVHLVECYACTDCPKVLANTTSKFCPYTSDYTKNNKCVVYAEKYTQMEKPWYIRGCAAERGSCADVARAHDANARIVKMIYCSECDGDKCNTNGVYRSLPNFAAAILFVIVTPLAGKYALS